VFNYLQCFLFIILFFFFACAQEDNTLVDHRDQQKYRTAKFGNQLWMIQNLNFNAPDSYCYNNQIDNCTTAGRFYSFEVAKNICPNGWKLPTDGDWKSLEKSLGMSETRIEAFREWRETANFEEDLESLQIQFAGIGDHTPNGFRSKNAIVRYWSSSDGPTNSQYGIFRMFIPSKSSVYYDQIPKKNLCCVRCIKE